MSRKVYRAAILSTCEDPSAVPAAEAVTWLPDGALVVEDGRIAACGPWAEIAPTLPADAEVEHLPGRLITPGFIDAHIHFPQVDVMAAWGGQLLDWLANHTFPAEMAFADRGHADRVAQVFLDQLLANGTTSALVFCTVHKTSAEALFEAALARNMRLTAGKVLMDREAPEALTDTAESGRADSEALIRAWHGRGRLSYAITPRFAVTSTDAQLAAAGELAAAYPDVAIHTHMAENHAEIARVAELFPQARDYLDVYDRFGLLTRRSVFAHCVHADDDMFRRIAAADASVAFCPSSNLMLGSGLYDLRRACGCGVRTALATDVGGGASFSMPSMIAEAYKVGQMRGEALDPLHGFYLATLAGARALRIDDRVGSLTPGKEADFVVLDLAATPLLARRTAGERPISETLFALAVLSDDRVVERTYLMGQCAHRRGAAA